MPRTLKSPLKLYFRREGNQTGSYVFIPHTSTINVGNGDSYTVVLKYSARPILISTGSLTEKWFDDGPPTINKYPWGIRGPSSTGTITQNIYDGSNNPGNSTGAIAGVDTYQLIFVRDFGADVIRTYLDGVLVDTDTDSTTGDVSSDRPIVIGGRDFTVVTSSRGLIGDFVLFSGAMSDADAATYYSTGVTALTKLQDTPLNEDEGFIANDDSGNSNRGILGGRATWRKRSYDENLVRNGDFEYAPPFTAASDTNSTWINGTAAGGTNPGGAQYGWFFKEGVDASAQFDSAESHSGTYSLKVSTLAAASWSEIVQFPSFGAPSPAQLKNYAIPVEPSTSYTCTYWMKTNYGSGDSNDGGRIAILEYTGTGTAGGGGSGTNVKTTTGWTQYTITFTTGANARFAVIRPTIYGHTGTATLIMDAWFDDITFKKTDTSPTLATRTLASNRTLIS